MKRAKPPMNPITEGQVGGAPALELDETRRQLEAARAELAEVRQAVEVTFDRADVGIAKVAPDGQWIRVNPKLCDLLGRAQDELLHHRFQDVTHPEDVQVSDAGRLELLEGKRSSFNVEKRYIRRGGVILWASVTVSAVHDSSGKPKYFISIIEDITERKRAQASRDSLEGRLRIALKASRLSVWQWDLTTGLDTWSEEQEALFGMAPGTFDGRHETFLGLIHPEDRHIVPAATQKAIEGNDSYHCEFRVIWGDGSSHWIASWGEVLRDSRGKAVGIVGATMDITNRKRADEDREELLRREQKARADAETANHRKDQFLALLSHELRTPLTPVLVRAELIEREADSPGKVREGARMIRHNVELEARLIDDLLDMTRISSGKLHLNLQAVDVHDSIRNALEIYASEIAGKGLQISLSLDAMKWRVSADPIRLQQVFWNLIGNAVKFTPDHGHIFIRSSDRGEDRVVIEVGDDGIGIEPQVLSRLFDPFEQGEKALTRRFGGLGLGLNISRSLVQIFGGTLHAFSRGKGQGATFTVELPATIALAAAPGALPDSPDAAEHGLAAANLRILLVEDNEETLRVLTRLLKSDGFQVTPANSYQSAMKASTAEYFDLLISDIGLPDGSGWDLMKALRNHHPMKGIALSGFGQDEDLQHSLEAGFTKHLVKPVNPRQLEMAIQELAV